MRIKPDLYAVIMAGGGGTRLWPISRKKHPKHVLPLLGERTLFQSTVDRLAGLIPPVRHQLVLAGIAERIGEEHLFDSVGLALLAYLNLHSVAGDDTSRAVFAPLHYEPNYGYPLLIWLHGAGGDVDVRAAGAASLATANIGGSLVPLGSGPLAVLLASSSAIMRRIEARISSIEGSWTSIFWKRRASAWSLSKVCL